MQKKNFTVVELFVVLASIMILAGLLLPVLIRGKSMAMEKACLSNLREIHVALAIYCENNKNYYPLEPTENNSHLGLTSALDADLNRLRDIFYCPQSYSMEEYAQDTVHYPSVGDATSLVNTDANWVAGNISYYYWSFKMPRMHGDSMWFMMDKRTFWPRTLKGDGIEKSSCYTYPTSNFDYDAQGNMQIPYPDVSPSQRWVLTDFFRQGAPFPHVYGNATSLTVAWLDGHAGLSDGRPGDNFR